MFNSSLVEQRLLLKAYVNITEEYGPSQQLIDFINFDNHFSKEIGLESFNSVSTQIQHELILSHIDFDKMDQIALESLSDKLRRLGENLTLGGAVGTFVAITPFGWILPKPVNIVIGGISLAALMSGMASIAVAKHFQKNRVVPYKSFKVIESEFDKFLKIDKMLLDHMPSTFEEKDWYAFYKLNENSPQPRGFTQWEDKVEFDQSGWDDKNLQEAAKWFYDKTKQVFELEKKYKDKIKKIDQWLRAAQGSDELQELHGDTISFINESVSSADRCGYMLTSVKSILDSVAKHFEVKK